MSGGRDPGSDARRATGDRTSPSLADVGLTAVELADAVHLAAVREGRVRVGPEPAPANAAGEIAGTVPRSGAGTGTESGSGGRGATGGIPSCRPVPDERRPRGPTRGPASRASVHAVPSSPDPATPPAETVHSVDSVHPVLGRRHELVAALSPFNLKSREGPSDQIDLGSTARDYARSLLESLHWSDCERWDFGIPIVPSLRPRELRAAHLTLLVDDGVSMLFQQGVVGAFTRLVRDSGVFRRVRELRFDSERHGEPLLRDARGHVRRLGKPGPRGAHIALVLTDGLGGGWRDRPFQEWIARVAEHRAVAIAHLLRPPLWRRGGIRTVPTELSAAWPAEAGGANTRYVRERSIAWADGDGDPSGTVVPVLPLTPDAVHGWASFVMSRGRTRLWVHAAEFPARQDAPQSEAPAEGGADGFDALGEVRRFHQSASPDAFELAVSLAVVPLVPRLVEAVCEDVLGGPAPSELTEVFFSGLVRMNGTGPGSWARGGAEPARWDFRPGARRALLSLGGRVPDIRRILGLAVSRLRQVDPWFGDLGRMLRGLRVVPPESPRTSHHWVNSMLPAVESIALSRHYADPIRVYADALVGHDSPSAGEALEDEAQQVTGLQSPQGPGSAREAGEVSGTPPVPTLDIALVGGNADTPENPSRGGKMNDPADPPTAHVSRTRGRPLNAIWVQVPRRNNAFTGREELLSSLRAQLVKGQQQVITALNGMSGVGKTELAKEYLYRYASEYDLICWIPSAHGNQLRESFGTLAARFGLDSAGAVSGHVLQDVLEALRRRSPFERWLLVFDNAQTRTELEPYLPVGGEGHVIITSRDSSWARRGGDTFLSIREFTRAESVDLLRRRGPASLTDAEAEQLAEELGDLPLALNQAAVWLHESGMATGEYLRQFANKSTEMLALLSPVDPDYPVPVAAAWNVSLDRLATTNPAALQLLQLCSFLAAAPIPRSLFNFARQIDAPAELRQALEDPALLGMAIRDIGRNSLAHIDHQRNTISLHRLVQRAVQAPMSDEEREALRHCAHQLLGRNDPQDDSADAFPRYTELVPHVWASEAWNCVDPWVRSLVIQLVRIAVISGEYDEANGLASTAYGWWRRTLGEQHRNTLHMALQISLVQRGQGRLEEGSALCESTLETLRETHGSESPEVLEAEREHVRNLRMAGRFEDSLTEAADIYRERVRFYGEDDPLTLDFGHTLGYSLLLSGDPRASADRYQDTLGRMEIVLGPDNLRIIGTGNGYAEALMELGRYHEAENLQGELVDRVTSELGADDVGTLANTMVHAVMRRRIGDHRGAFALSERAWQRFLAKQGVDSNDTLYAALVHTLSLSAVNRHDEALELAQETGERYVKLLGEQHPHVAAASVNRAVVLRRLGRAVEARELDEAALDLLLDRLGGYHPSTLACMVNLANDHFLTGDVVRARDRDERTLAACRAELGDRHPLTLLALRNLLVDRSTQGEVVAEEFSALEAAYRDVMGARHPATLSIRQTVRGDADIFVTQL